MSNSPNDRISDLLSEIAHEMENSINDSYEYALDSIDQLIHITECQILPDVRDLAVIEPALADAFLIGTHRKELMLDFDNHAELKDYPESFKNTFKLLRDAFYGCMVHAKSEDVFLGILSGEPSYDEYVVSFFELGKVVETRSDQLIPDMKCLFVLKETRRQLELLEENKVRS